MCLIHQLSECTLQLVPFPFIHTTKACAECVVCSLCQGLLQCVWGVFICYTASPVLWAKLGQIVPQQSHQLLGFGVQTDPDKERKEKRECEK